MAFEVQNFQEDVLEMSRTQPVLVDFWAPWCGPCRVLGPVLEKLAEENEGAWKLVKVNSDQHQDLSRKYGVRGIPAVKLFVDGNVVDEFVGALPEPQVRRWLAQAMPSESKQRLDEAAQALAAEDTETGERLLREIIRDEPTNAQALAMLAHLLVFTSPDEATPLASEAANADARLLHFAEAIKTLARLLTLQQSPEALPDEPGRDTYKAALDALAQQHFDPALAHFIKGIQQNRYYDDDGARKACIALFTLLGPHHPITHKHRRSFDMALY